MADLNDLLKGREQTEATAWMIVRWWEHTAKEGEPIDSGDGKPFRILIRNAGCKEYQDALSAFQAGNRAKLAIEETNGDRAGMIAAMTAEGARFTRRSTMSLLVRNWENLTSNGEPMPCTPENMELIFTEYPKIYDQVALFAFTGANYGLNGNSLPSVDMVTEIEKKSYPPPDGDSVAASENEQTTALEM